MYLVGLFANSKKAGEAVAELKQKGYTDHISILAKDLEGEVTAETVKEDVDDGTVAGAVTGTAVGALTGLLAGVVTVTLPAGVFVVAGPLAGLWAVSGAGVGALAGGVVGALVDAGFEENKAKELKEHLLRGEVLVAVDGESDKMANIQAILENHKPIQVFEVQKEDE